MIRIYSFSYMFGQDKIKIIQNCDQIIDCRDLPDPQGKGIGESGLERAVQDYVFEREKTAFTMANSADEIIANLMKELPGSIAFGCTGGKNRSVALAETLASRISDDSFAETLKSGYNKYVPTKVIHLGLPEWGIEQ